LEEPLDELKQEVRQSAEAAAVQVKAELVAELEAKAFDWIARGRAANIELGRIFNQIKYIIEHGSWETYFSEKFAPRGVALRTAQLYMKMAGEADAVSKDANVAFFPPATDPQAQAIKDATEMAQGAVAIAGGQSPEASKSNPAKKNKKVRKERVRLDGIYKLPLFMTGDEKDATDALLDSQDWHYAEMEITALLRQLHIKFGIVNDPAAPEVQAAPRVRRRVEIISGEPEADPYPGVAAGGAAHMGDGPEEQPQYGDALD
jgi:hypothetical protein